jgi:hypothetical protein
MAVSCRLRKPKDAGQPPAPCAAASHRLSRCNWQRVVPQRLGNERLESSADAGIVLARLEGGA